jgi:uncharacterized protein GlcG (DUF336 family)
MKMVKTFALASILALAAASQAQAQAYGASVSNEQAHKVVNAAIAEARKQGFTMAVAVVDTSGQLVMFEKIDGTQTGSINVSQDKAASAALYKRPTKAFQDAVAGGGAGLRVLTLRGANAVEGGLPLLVDGKIIGAVGVSGGSSDQDGVIAKAGADVLAAK